MARVHTPPRSPRKRGTQGEYGTPIKNQCFGRMDAGQSLLDISNQMHIHRNTLSNWWRQRKQNQSDRRLDRRRSGKPRKVLMLEIKRTLKWILNRKYQGRSLSFREVLKRF